MSAPDSYFFAVTQINEITVIKLLLADDCQDQSKRDFDLLHEYAKFRNDLICTLKAIRPSKVVLDFNGLRNVGRGQVGCGQLVVCSAMNGAYSIAKKVSEEFQCQWRICGLTKGARNAYNASSLRTTFPLIHDTQSEAILAFMSSHVDNS